MASETNSVGSYLTSQARSSKIDDNYLKELNEDLELRKQELLEMLKPVEDENPLLLQKLMFNLEEKQKSLQIMRQILAKKESDNSSVTELIKEAEEMKQNLERKNMMLRNEMEMLWNKTSDKEEMNNQQKSPQIKRKENLKDEKALKFPISLRKTKNELETSNSEKAKYDFHGKVIELKIEELKNYQKVKDQKVSLYLEEKVEPKQAFLILPGSQEIRVRKEDYKTLRGRAFPVTSRFLGARRATGSSSGKAARTHLSGGFLKPATTEAPAAPRTPAGEADDRRLRRPARQGIASVWDATEPAFVCRAHPRRVLSANRALLARLGAFPGPSRPGSPPRLPASNYSATEPLAPPFFH
ncbi:putative coiled-coil domain-containing protein 196 [Sorex fumeus]|uniref:putative coiled-coil domain-containing protein 196 n=1 Tax=Sorex fumeus TaxID=62283 RepID=UPI0024AD016B|nr:putative coiled-coil domain-containing protein 196 [Sorex fumeus]